MTREHRRILLLAAESASSLRLHDANVPLRSERDLLTLPLGQTVERIHWPAPAADQLETARRRGGDELAGAIIGAADPPNPTTASGR